MKFVAGMIFASLLHKISHSSIEPFNLLPSPVSIQCKLYLGKALAIFSHVLRDGERFSLMMRVIVTLLVMPMALLKEFLFSPSSSIIVCILLHASIVKKKLTVLLNIGNMLTIYTYMFVFILTVSIFVLTITNIGINCK